MDKDKLIKELEIALNPKFWTMDHIYVWHRSIPDIQKGFDRLKQLAHENANQKTMHQPKTVNGEANLGSGSED